MLNEDEKYRQRIESLLRDINIARTRGDSLGVKRAQRAIKNLQEEMEKDK